jgi:predicted DsbA family dithiol-disulfide isomerase
MPSILRLIAVVNTYYYTDPACPWSWALEPALRKLSSELGDGVSITYVMGGMAREFGAPDPFVTEMLEAADRSGMPVDARLWLAGAPRSSHPACIAVKVAAEQGDPEPYLRWLREGLMCRRRKLDTTDALVQEARGVPGLDLDRFARALASHGPLEAFAADLDRAGTVPAEHRDPATGRVKLPSIEFVGPDGQVHGVYGYSDYGALRDAAAAAGAIDAVAGAGGAGATGAGPTGAGGRPSIEDALRRWHSMATAEVTAVCDLPGPRAPAELWRLATEWRVRPERLGSGELWTVA